MNYHPQMEFILEGGFRRILGGPLFEEDRKIGMLCFFPSEDKTNENELVKLFKKVKSVVNPFIGSIRAVEILHQKLALKDALMTISESITKIEDRNTLLNTVYQIIKRYIDHDCFGLFVLDETKEYHYELVSDEMLDHSGIQNKIEEKFGKDALYKHAGTGIETQMSQPTAIYNILDLQKNAIYHHPQLDLMVDMGLRHMISGPLIYRDEPIGLLTLQTKNTNYYNENHLALFKAISNQLSIVVHNMLTQEKIAKFNQQLVLEKDYLMEEVKIEYNYEEIVGESEAMQEVYKKIQQVASFDSSVMILGETGTGKELVARAIHNYSPRKDRPLIKINCANLSKDLFESELFGYEKGAFTGAVKRKIGKFELANKSTLFLDEIGELPLELQAKLLRVLQEKTFEPLGSNQIIECDFRLLAATNRDLKKEVKEGRFRSDLFYRLMVFPIVLPPLRERKEDVPALSQYFLNKYANRVKRSFKGIAKKSLQQMKSYHWPGNVRELEHLIERSVIISNSEVLELNIIEDLHQDVSHQSTGNFLPKTIKEVEVDLIMNTLKWCKGKIRGEDGAAKLLDLKPTTLESRMKKLGIKKEHVLEQLD